MGKKSKRQQGMGEKKNPGASPSPAVIPAERLSKRGKRVIAGGVGVLVVGFGLLSYTDPAGQNWASTLSPFLIIAGYIFIGVGIVLRDPEPSTVSSPTTL